jgi:hypothetical protein
MISLEVKSWEIIKKREKLFKKIIVEQQDRSIAVSLSLIVPDT